MSQGGNVATDTGLNAPLYCVIHWDLSGGNQLQICSIVLFKVKKKRRKKEDISELCWVVVSSYTKNTYESGIDLLFCLSARKRINAFPNMLNYYLISFMSVANQNYFISKETLSKTQLCNNLTYFTPCPYLDLELQLWVDGIHHFGSFHCASSFVTLSYHLLTQTHTQTVSVNHIQIPRSDFAFLIWCAQMYQVQDVLEICYCVLTENSLTL